MHFTEEGVDADSERVRAGCPLIEPEAATEMQRRDDPPAQIHEAGHLPRRERHRCEIVHVEHRFHAIDRQTNRLAAHLDGELPALRAARRPSDLFCNEVDRFSDGNSQVSPRPPAIPGSIEPSGAEIDACGLFKDQPACIGIQPVQVHR